jgi:hypothetical protein
LKFGSKIAADRNDLKSWFGGLAALPTFAAITPGERLQGPNSAGAPPHFYSGGEGDRVLRLSPSLEIRISVCPAYSVNRIFTPHRVIFERISFYRQTSQLRHRRLPKEPDTTKHV